MIRTLSDIMSVLILKRPNASTFLFATRQRFFQMTFTFWMNGEFPAGEDGIVLYPHFYSKMTLGWFDHKQLSQLADGWMLSDVLLLAPSPSFVAELPGRVRIDVTLSVFLGVLMSVMQPGRKR